MKRMPPRTAALRRILVPTDGSPPARRAARQAAALARKLNAALYGLHVITPFEVQAYHGAPPVLTRSEFGKRAQRAADGILAALRKAAGRSVPCLCHVVWEISAADAIVAAAQRHRCGLIVMGSHGRTGLARLLLGSVAQKVLARSRVPVMICR